MLLKRRDVFRVVLTTGVVAATVGVQPAAADKTPDTRRDKRRSQYRPESPEVQTFYRVNSYPTK